MTQFSMVEAKDDFSDSISWWSGSHNRLHQSPWLQATLSDLDDKIKIMVNIILDDGDSFTERAETFYKRRPELLKIVQDLHNSYCSLAEKYDQLRSTDFGHLRSPSSASPSVRLLQSIKNENTETTKTEESPISHCHSVQVQEQDSDPETQISRVDQDSLNESPIPISNKQSNNSKIEEEKDIDGTVNEKGLKKIIDGGDLEKGNQEKDKIWNQQKLKVSKLIEDNLRQQSELIKRNDEKREVIKQLRAQINRLTEENKALRTCLPSYKVDIKRRESRVSKLKSLNCIGKFQS